jgi:hypothetical protein
VLPIYHHFKVRVLPTNPLDKPDLEEGVKSLIANAFIVHDDNPDDPHGKPRVATMSLTRKPDQAIFQFIWLSIKQPLGKVVGGIK